MTTLDILFKIVVVIAFLNALIIWARKMMKWQAAQDRQLSALVRLIMKDTEIKHLAENEEMYQPKEHGKRASGLDTGKDT